MKTSWPKGSALPRKAKRRKRPPSKAVRAERRTALDKSQLPGRGEYAVKVFAWAEHEGKQTAIEAAMLADEPSPIVTPKPECIDPESLRPAKGAHTIIKLRDPSPVPYMWRSLQTRQF